MSPVRPLGPCTAAGCPNRATAGHGRCAAHQREDRHRFDQQRGTAAQRGYGSAWSAVRAAHLAMEPLCRVCGAQATDVDHVIARRDGGSDDHANLRSLCHRHHSQRTAGEHGFGRRAV